MKRGRFVIVIAAAVAALAITFTAHVAYYLITTIIGVVGLWRLGKSFASLWQTLRAGSLTAQRSGKQELS